MKFDVWPWKTIGHLFYATSSFVHHSIAISEFKLKLQSGNPQFRSKSAIFFVPCDLEIWRMTLKNNGAPLIYCFKLSASFHSHQWIQTKVTVLKRSIRLKIGDYLSRVTFKFDKWPWKITGHLLYVASSFLHHFIAISELKLSYSPETLNWGQNRRFFVRCDLQIWRMTLNNNRAPLLCCFKLSASFHSHWWIKTWVTVR